MPANDFTLQNELASSRLAELTLASNRMPLLLYSSAGCHQMCANVQHAQLSQLHSQYSNARCIISCACQTAAVFHSFAHIFLGGN